jgi:hypothetical protein
MRNRSGKKQMVPLVAALVLAVAAVVTTGVYYHNVDPAEPVSASELEAISSATEDAYAKGVVDIDLSDLGSLDADGVKVENGTVKIGSAGVYTLTGSLSGQIEVNTKGKVYLELDGIQVTSPAGAALFVKNAKKVTVVLAPGSANSLASTASGDADSAALFTNDSLYVTGTGTLTVTGNNSEGITSDDSIVIDNGTLVVTAAGDGLSANDDITVNGGDVSVTARGDGLDSNGTVHVNGGKLVALGGTALGDGGVDVRGDFVITGGTVIAGGNLMAALGNASRQMSVCVTSAAIQAAGTAVTLRRDGKEVFSFTPAVAYENVLISSADLTRGVTYQAYLGDKAGNLVVASR